MSSVQIINTLFLRSHLDKNKAHLKSYALSPDIIPQYGKVVTAASLEKAYQRFIDLPLVSHEDNNIYVRAIAVPIEQKAAHTAWHTETPKASVTLQAVPSELILWPQVWNKATLLEPGPIVLDIPQAQTVTAIDTPFVFRPQNLGGIHHSLIEIHDPVFSHQLQAKERFRSTLPSPPPACQNWRDYYAWVQTDKRVTYSSVWVADPSANLISVSTRLRIFENEEDTVKLLLLIEHAGLPPTTEVSLACDSNQIFMERKPIGDNSEVFGVNAELPNGFDAIITLTVFPPEDGRPLQGYSWISLQANAVSKDAHGNTTHSLLGSENIVFEAEATRNLRFAKPTQNSPRREIGDPANLWWFRDTLGDTNDFPRPDLKSHSPDIQVMGAKPDANAQSDLGAANADVDYTTNGAITISNGQPNYIYIRGNCGSDMMTIQSRAYALPCQVMIYPSQYSQWSIRDADQHGDQQIAIRSVTTTAPDSFNVFANPFNLSDPPDPNTLGPSDHYCVVAEVRVVTDAVPDPSWPHENEGDFATPSDYHSWILGTPQVTFRNITWVRNTSAANRIFRTALTLQNKNGSSSTEFWLLATATNAPPDSEWQLTGSGDSLPGIDISFPREKLGASGAAKGIHFSGLPQEDYVVHLSLQWWWTGEVLNGINFQFDSGISHLGITATSNDKASRHPKVSVNWSRQIGDAHPGLPSAVTPRGNRLLVDPIGRKTNYRCASSTKAEASNDGFDDDYKLVHFVGSDRWNVR